MKFKALIAVLAVCITAASMCACSAKNEQEAKNMTETAVTTVESAPDVSLPDETFQKLPEEAEDKLNCISAAADSIFPDVKGKKMFGYKGNITVTTADGQADCCVFEFYTYKKSEYTKVASIAQTTDGSQIYYAEGDSENYTPYTKPEKEQEWYERETETLRSVNNAY